MIGTGTTQFEGRFTANLARIFTSFFLAKYHTTASARESLRVLNLAFFFSDFKSGVKKMSNIFFHHNFFSYNFFTQSCHRCGDDNIYSIHRNFFVILNKSLPIPHPTPTPSITPSPSLHPFSCIFFKFQDEWFKL